MLDYIKQKYNIKKITLLDGGYSFCDKYKADQYVLKVFSFEEFDHMMERIDFLEFLNKKEMRVPKVFAYGTHGGKCYQLFSYLKGDTGHSLSSYSEEVQYSIGYEAGKELRTYHTYKRPDQIDIYSFHKNKYKKILKQYNELNITFEYEKECMKYVEENIHLLKGRKTYQLHGDFHPENMCFNTEGYVGAYDFERNKKTDYVREFERTLYFTRQFSLEFVKGFLKGYEFDEFDILKLYLVMSIFNSFVWAGKYYPDQLDEFRLYSKMVVEDFDVLKSELPLYLGG